MAVLASVLFFIFFIAFAKFAKKKGELSSTTGLPKTFTGLNALCYLKLLFLNWCLLNALI